MSRARREGTGASARDSEGTGVSARGAVRACMLMLVVIVGPVYPAGSGSSSITAW